MSEAIFAGLNAEQRQAVEAVRGPVCILAGAGSGKTTTITRRIAHQVASGAFAAGEILAVTFTDKAAGEMRARLGALGVEGVRASTFHSAALGQLRFFASEPPGRILSSKALPLRHIGNTLPRPYRFRPAGDLATEIEWAKNRRITPGDYLRSLGGHEPPIPADLMARVYGEYERRKTDQGYVDFEDLLELAVRLLDADAGALAQVRERYRALTVDEYQDVNLLQQSLLDRWLGERDELCAVGDDYQSIYAFTGASPEYLLAMPTRFPDATVVRLEDNYRSTPEVLAAANRLVPQLGGAEKVLRAVRDGGPEPVTKSFPQPEAESEYIVARVRALHDEGVPYEEMALLYRTNARSADFEEALTAADLPFQGAALLSRDAARQLLKALRGAGGTAVSAQVRCVATEQGLLDRIPEGLGEREVTRQNDLARLVRLAAKFDDGERTLAEFAAHLEQRFGRGGEARGVHFLTYHRAKGLEFEAVFLPRLEERELPSKLSKTQAAIAEERRLLYVGMTRAKRHLAITWAGKPSRFLAELGVEREALVKPVEPDDPLYGALKRWRLEVAKAEERPAYVIFHNSTLAEIVRRAPRTRDELAAVPGVGPAKLERYGDEVLAALRG
ncbi:MAG: ATP-dependent DNA helicase UvrD2 [Actinobacteria bacterium]|nr:ATP-dependent DNA helicase UvrD2 [Actinomycetota bacterium]